MKLYICQTLDGYIADHNFKFDFLDQFNEMIPTSSNENIKNTFENFMKDIDVTVQGYTTYKSVYDLIGSNPQSEYENYVLTNSHLDAIDNTVTKFLTYDDFKQIDLTGKNTWLIGGSQIIKLALEDNLVSDLIIFQLPILLGDGIRLFDHINYGQLFKLKSVDYDQNFIQYHYTTK